jgi:hypothetical protein
MKNEKGGACGRYGVRDRRKQAFGETLWKETTPKT